MKPLIAFISSPVLAPPPRLPFHHPVSLQLISHPAHQLDVIRTKAFSWNRDTQALFSETAKKQINLFLRFVPSGNRGSPSESL